MMAGQPLLTYPPLSMENPPWKKMVFPNISYWQKKWWFSSYSHYIVMLVLPGEKNFRNFAKTNLSICGTLWGWRTFMLWPPATVPLRPLSVGRAMSSPGVMRPMGAIAARWKNGALIRSSWASQPNPIRNESGFNSRPKIKGNQWCFQNLSAVGGFYWEGLLGASSHLVSS